MSTKKVSKQKHAGGRPSRGLNVRKIIMLDAPLGYALAVSARKYGSESQVVRLALTHFFLTEGVSISNGSREQQPTQEAA